MPGQANNDGEQMRDNAILRRLDQSTQSRKLKIEDALFYMNKVKYEFSNQPEVYGDFLDLLGEFKTKRIDYPGVIARISNLFNGHPELIMGFNMWLPPNHQIEIWKMKNLSVMFPSEVVTTSKAGNNVFPDIQHLITS